MTQPTVGQAQAWRPDALRRIADGWADAAIDLQARIDGATRSVIGSRDFWTGSAADAAREGAVTLCASGAALTGALARAVLAAREGADRIARAQADVAAGVGAALAEGFEVSDDGSVSATDPVPLLVALSGGSDSVAREFVAVRANELSRRIMGGLETLGSADGDAARGIGDAFAATPADGTVPTTPAAAWPVRADDILAGWPAMTQLRIADQIAAMTPEQRQEFIGVAPAIVGNTDGVPWDMRVAANRINIARAIVEETGTDPDAKRRIGFYQDLLAEVEDPATGRRVHRQILGFDPARSTLIELNGDLDTAKSVAVLVPGMNTTLEGSAADTTDARRFVTATHGEVAAITYLGGPFPAGGNVLASLLEATDTHFALEMAPRLAAFSADVDRTVDAMDRQVAVTYVGHSYGGSILGTAEALGLTADRTLYLAAAGAGVGVDDPGDWHNRNPDVLRFSMTAPGDVIQLVQGLPGGLYGADPDEMPGVIRLATGYYDDGRLMAGPRAHTDVIDCPASDSWRTILGVITGNRELIQVARQAAQSSR
ncbi:alpha/beta hydrolase [Mycobacterium sp. URHB0044]|uniref:alpha/beta hydrolase n=1 Tax=Mycobacterium sp. URHB0044 TaxID=1380386 RepID=UPI00048C0322|nr:alpha/beta hydrolase [Mycobacterium sp. URHB0044]